MTSRQLYTSSDLCELARGLYTEGAWVRRTLQVHRPRICPFEVLISSVPESARILDIGCGSGLFLGLLAGSGRIVQGHGFDASEDAIRLANNMKARHTNGDCLEFTQRDVADDWPEDHYDVVSVIDLLHHVPSGNQRSVIEEAVKRVKPGGILIFKDMSAFPHPLAWASVLHDLVFARQWINIVPYTSVKSWIEAAGFAETDHARINMYWYGHELGIFKRPADS